ncbi:putative WRKY transcription factor 19 [Vitis vinifera]|uniref:Putative WRKY transcription factor 19 n=1 Tax=Vitis vinifera TaxID=29760 RepID=A0A438CLL4_VITVI|nr:putative WRKY transcription factor 19 [Vitis vinifera]
MHDLLQQMGREVVRQEGLKESHKYPQEPGKRSRLWDPKDVESVLIGNTGTKAIEGLFVEVSTSNQIQFSANSFVKMKSLRLLKVYHMIENGLDYFEVDLPEDFEIPSSELRYLHFEGYRLQCLPKNFHAKNLVELDLIGSNIKQLWKENEILDKLKVINLSYSEDLVEIPDFLSVPNLEILILEGCTRLHSLPRNFHKLEHLRSLSCWGCSKLESFPKIKGNMSELRKLNLGGTPLMEVPSSIGHLKALQHLDLTFCKSLRSLSESICNLSFLETLILVGCSNLKGFPEIKDDMENLKRLDLTSTGIEELPSSIGHLKALQHLDMSSCKSLRSLSESICNLSSLETLILVGCSNLKGFPEIKDDMENLKRLDLSETGIEELPSSIGRLKALQHLDLSRNQRLYGNLEDLSLSSTGIEELPSSIGHLKALKHLELVSLPDSICNLSSLKALDVQQCPKLERVEVNLVGSLDLTCWILKQRVIWCSSNLRHAVVEGEGLNHHVSSLSSLVESCTRDNRGIGGDCFHLYALEVFFRSLTEGEILNHICHLSSLQNLSLDGNHFSSIPATSFSFLTEKPPLESLPEASTNSRASTSLRVLDVHDCPCLETLSSPSSLLCFSMFECFKSAIEETECGSIGARNHNFCPWNNGIPEWISHKKKDLK